MGVGSCRGGGRGAGMRLLLPFLVGELLLPLVFQRLVVVLLEEAGQHGQHLHIVKLRKVRKPEKEHKRSLTVKTADISPHRDLMRLRPKGCRGHGMVEAVIGGWSPISAIRAAVDHAWTKSVLPNWEAIAAFLEQMS